MTTLVEVRYAVDADRPAIAAMLARAFRNEGFASWFVRHDKHRDKAFRLLFDVNLQLSMPYGHVYTTAQRHSAALWVPPHKWRLDLLNQLKLLPTIVTVTGLKNAWSRNIAVLKAEQLHPQEPHYYLLALGTEPAYQGQGLGSRVLQPGLERCDREQMPAYLETPTKGLAESFYTRYGFNTLSTFVMPHNGPTIWQMWRDPQ